MKPSEFLRAMRFLPVPEAIPPAHTWERHRFELHKHCQTDDLERFLQWSTIQATMFVSEAPYIFDEYTYLELENWDRWRPATRESIFGNPPRLSYDEGTSGNLIHQAYHLAQWEDCSNKRVEDLSCIVEFGGGYGAMCSLIRRLGFKGDYIIYDNPEFSLLQQFYLSNLGMQAFFRIIDGHDFRSVPRGDLLIALYSLTEVSKDLRQEFTAFGFPSYLIAHQDKYRGELLCEWSDEFMAARDDLLWMTWPNPNLKRHRYVVGI